MITATFAGEARRFALGTPRNWPTVAVGCFEGERFGNLATLVELARRNLLGDGAVRHVLAHALAGPDNPLGMLRAEQLVRDEMQGKPLAAYLKLVLDVLVDAYVGPADDG